MGEGSGPLALQWALVALASAPDDASDVDATLERIVTLVAAFVEPAEYASMTAYRDGSYSTVATSNQIALAVDEAQYGDQDGPCLRALGQREPVAVPDIATVMHWPGFRREAGRLGLRSSLSIPLFAGSGTVIAALNVYARNSAALGDLTQGVHEAFDLESPQPPLADGELDEGSIQLLTGLREATALQRHIQISVGMLMARHQISASTAYTRLRDAAATNRRSLIEEAEYVREEVEQGNRPPESG